MRATSFGLILFACVFAFCLPVFAADADRPHTDALGDLLPDAAIARFGTAQFRVPPGVETVALSPDGKLLAVGGDERVRLLDSITGKDVRSIQKKGWLSLNVRGQTTFSPDSRLLAISTVLGLELCDVTTGELLNLARETGYTRPYAASFSGDGKLLAFGEEIQQQLAVTLWDVPGKKRLRTITLPQNRSVRLALSPDGKMLATWGEVNSPRDRRQPAELQLWEVSTGKKSRCLTFDDERSVRAAVFSPDSKQVLLSEGDSALSVWEVSTGTRLRRFAARWGVGSFLAFSPDAKAMVAAGDDGTVQFWEAATCKRLETCQGPSGRLCALVFDKSCKLRAAGLDGQAICVWEAPSGKNLAPSHGHTTAVRTLAFGAGGKLLSGSTDGVRVWDVNTGREVRHLRAPPDEDRHPRLNPPTCVISPNGHFVLWAGVIRSDLRVTDLRVTDAATGEEVAQLTVDSGSLPNPTLVFAKGGDTVAFPSGVADPKEFTLAMHIWDLSTAQATGAVKMPFVRLYCMALSPDGKYLAASMYLAPENYRSSLWDLTTGKEIREFGGKLFISRLVFSPDGTLVAGGTRDTIRLWDPSNGHEIRSLEGAKGRSFSDPIFSPDGRTLAAITQNTREAGEGQVVLWELASGEIRAEYMGHRGPVTAVAFAPDGRTLATGGADTTILLWDLTGRTEKARRAQGKLTADELAALWDDLAGDAPKAHAAMGRLMAAPVAALVLFAKELKPVAGKPPTEKEVERLLAELEDDSFEVREKASRALSSAGPVVRPALVKALAAKPGAEKKQRLEELIKESGSLIPPREIVRPLRALEVLEHINTPEARRLLEALAKGNPSARLTTEAETILRRLPVGQ